MRTTAPRLRDALGPAAIGWLLSRIAVACGFLLAEALYPRLRTDAGRLHLDQGLLTWDASFYRVLAEGWYSGPATPDDAVRFFPVFPGAARALAPVFGGREDIALLLLANVCALAAGVVVWHLATEIDSDVRLADRAAVFVALVPASNVFAFGYSEPMMLLLAAVALLALRRGAPWWAAAVGLAAGALRPTGVLLALPAAIEAWRWWRASDPSERTAARLAGWAAAVTAPVIALAGTLLYLAGHSGSLGEVFRIHRGLRGGFRDPITRLGQAALDVLGGGFGDLYNLAFAVGFLALLVVAWRRRQPLAWLVFMAATWVVAVGGNNMDSTGRYCVVAAPFAIALAQWAQRRWQQVVAVAGGMVGLAWFTSEVLLGRVIP